MACSKIFSGDLPELINEILPYLRNDYKTLYSCILVNRLWCRLAIPLLWEDPFSKKFPKNYRFIEIYLHYLNDNDKAKLNEYGIITDSFPTNTLFNYPSFIKCLKIHEICLSIKLWNENISFLTIKEQPGNFRKLTKDYNQDMTLARFIFLLLTKIFIEYEANLHTFEFKVLNTYWNKDINDYIKSTFEIILQNPNFISNIKNLKFLSDGLANNLLVFIFLKCIYSNCNSISSLYIHALEDNNADEDLSKLINSQQNLQKIYFDNSDYYYLKSLKNSNCLNTLRIIIFHNIYLYNLEVNLFSEVFEQLNVLESVHILYCYPLDSTIIQLFNLTKPFKLKSLLMDQRSILQIEPLKLLLQKSGDYLENIGFETSMNNELKLQLLNLIKIYCFNIKFIDLNGFDNQNILPAFYLIKNIQRNLNYISINFAKFNYQNFDRHVELSSFILRNLGQILPNRLEYLSLALKFNINDLEVFINNSQNIFIRKLLIKNIFYHTCENLLPCIKNSIMREKRVTYLAIENNHVFSNSERNDLFDLKNEVEEFKLYGIQVTDYNNLYIKLHDFINELY
ncbi:hypothetical protein RhiirA1_532897 [Rhizophagus irregularis]|uniref:Uncharacterized protein n=1 Tax=Rhizophagus irregularis TaxID=588596 RepID=A0A2I1F6M8_9GLOM|nr:hypothetical protein RhiirA1_532897 [Rhizophagus irregularis]PKY30010.1 hypothetical protein RhiirB3_530827 [Rhizophagus irregularis]